jgi:cytochrome c oxidase subunit 2
MGLTMVLDLLAATDNLSTFDPASPSAESSRNQFILVFFITGGIFLLVEGVLVYMLIRNRRHRGATDSQPPQVYGSMPIEIAWTAAPFLIVFVLFLLVARELWEIRIDPNRPPAGSKPLYVTVIGHQWWWEYHFPASPDYKHAFTTANEFYFPVDEPDIPRPVFLKLQSADVCHSFWVPRLGGKIDLIPGRTNSLWLQTREEGLFLGQCSEYCGTSHANMLLRVRTVPKAEFDRWAANEEKPAVDTPANREGRDYFLSLSCVNCHTIRGTPASGTFGPELTHLMTREMLAAGILQNTPANIRDWIRNPQQFKQGCLMPAFTLSDSELDKVVSYLTTLR